MFRLSSVSESICLLVGLYIYLSVCVFLGLSISVSYQLFVSLHSICLYWCFSVPVVVYLYLCQSASKYYCVCPICVSVHFYVCANLLYHSLCLLYKSVSESCCVVPPVSGCIDVCACLFMCISLFMLVCLYILLCLWPSMSAWICVFLFLRLSACVSCVYLYQCFSISVSVCVYLFLCQSAPISFKICACLWTSVSTSICECDFLCIFFFVSACLMSTSTSSLSLQWWHECHWSVAWLNDFCLLLNRLKCSKYIIM